MPLAQLLVKISGMTDTVNPPCARASAVHAHRNGRHRQRPRSPGRSLSTRTQPYPHGWLSTSADTPRPAQRAEYGAPGTTGTDWFGTAPPTRGGGADPGQRRYEHVAVRDLGGSMGERGAVPASRRNNSAGTQAPPLLRSEE